MKNQAYWSNRQKQLNSQLEKDEEKLRQKLSAEYDKQSKRLEKEIAAYYQQYGTNDVIEYRTLLLSLFDADRQLLMERMDEFAQKYPQYAHLMPVRESIYKLDRLEGLQMSIRMRQLEIGAVDNTQLEQHLSEYATKSANVAAEQLGFGKNFYNINSDVVKMTINKKWINDKNFSERIWDNRKKLADYLCNDFASAVVRGDSYQKCINALKDRFDNVSRNDMFRLIYTEDTYVTNEASAKTFEEYYEQYQFHTVDGNACKTCKGINKKIFYFKDRKPGLNFPPLHTWCRCYYTTVIPGRGTLEEEYAKLMNDKKQAESEFISDDWKGLKYPQRKKRSDFATDDEWQAFRKSYIEDFNKYNNDVDRIIKNHDSKVENITEKKFIKWAEERGIENVNIKGMGKTAMADFMSSYDSMIEKLPKAAGKLKSVDLVSTKGSFSINQKALAWSNNDTSIHFAKSHFSKDKYSDVLQQEILSCVTGLNPDGANPYLHTYQHEMGHLIEKWVGKEAGGVDKLKEEMFKIFEGNLPDISDYGNNHGYGEWFAEMTSSYLNGTKSEKVEKFGGVLKKYFGSPDIAKSAESGIINTGSVSGALNPYSKEAGKHAVQYYESVRHMSTDTIKISKATHIKKDKIDKIKNHIFIQEHDLLSGRKRFDPSYDMAQSWQRLIGGNYEEKDLVLLKHEYAELRYMEKGMTQNEAHIKASKRYNYAKYFE